ncbi:DUF4340 domain-containing protein [Alteromonas halophila]|uniref:DUF4340 domain-containing protein n=1 Tax=Alteromonas halophila TaxID=516698 RepID=A0A918JKT3_9ALTE|nr:DUF4340 domain-containing protein [Alteromonas halophila]GGW86320.1 hypothetical protein GCM10007391_19990 [Alteromonas halophila]
MNWRIFILALLTVASASAAYYLLSSRPQLDQPQSAPVLRGLTEDAATISEVRVSDAQGIRFSARLVKDQWQATHLDSDATFPVNQTRLRDLVEKLTQARIAERKTSNQAYYDRLGVGDIDNAESASVRVTLMTATTRYSLIVGKASEHGQGQFVRERGAPQVLLTDTVIPLPRTTTDWLRQDIVPFTADEITQISIDNGEENVMLLNRADDQQWIWAQRPEERELRYPSVLTDTVLNMVAINFESVMVFRPDHFKNKSDLTTITFMLSDGRQIEAWLSGADDNGNHQLRLLADNASWLSNWVFTLAPYQAEALTPHADTLLKSVPAEPEATDG